MLSVFLAKVVTHACMCFHVATCVCWYLRMYTHCVYKVYIYICCVMCWCVKRGHGKCDMNSQSSRFTHESCYTFGRSRRIPVPLQTSIRSTSTSHRLLKLRVWPFTMGDATSTVVRVQMLGWYSGPVSTLAHRVRARRHKFYTHAHKLAI